MGAASTPEIAELYRRLPPEAKKEAADFLSFLGLRYPRARAGSSKGLRARRCGKFLGMWRDRADMADSTAWVRHMRKSHWR